MLRINFLLVALIQLNVQAQDTLQFSSRSTNGTKIIYVGQSNAGKANGFGKTKLDNGNFYEGNWINNEITGYGKMVYRNGDIYVGDFLEATKNGRGINCKKCLYIQW
jgi:hypothetical protein